MQYQYCDVPDSLSRVLYLDLIDDARKVVKSKILLIDDRVALGEFQLPVDFIPRNYMFRAYTNWMRNFGDALFYTKPVPVLKIQEKPQPLLTLGATTTNNLVIGLDKEMFKHREQIDFSVVATNAAGDTIGANLSVAVTDSKQVVSIPDADNIVSAMEGRAVTNPANVFFKVERGVGIKGTFLNKKQEPESVSLTAIVGDFDQVFSVRTDATGRFEIKDIYLYDSAIFRLQAKSKKGVPYGTIRFEPNSVPPITTWKRLQKFTIVDAGSPQRIMTDYQTEPGTLLLKETTVTASRIEDPADEVQHKIFGKPDYVVTSEDLMKAGTTELTLALRGKVPSLTVTTYTDNQGVHNVIRLKAASSFQLGNEPLVLIDGNPVGAVGGSGAGDRLRTLDINMVDRVEITIRANSMYGDAGKNGVIAVFTKLYSAGKNFISVDTKTMYTYTLKGFTAPQEFRAPDYASQNLPPAGDYWSTLFWQPLVKTSREKPVAQLSFYAADLTTRYRIVVEGMLDTGEPVRSEVFLIVSDH